MQLASDVASIMFLQHLLESTPTSVDLPEFTERKLNQSLPAAAAVAVQ